MYLRDKEILCQCSYVECCQYKLHACMDTVRTRQQCSPYLSNRIFQPCKQNIARELSLPFEPERSQRLPRTGPYRRLANSLAGGVGMICSCVKAAKAVPCSRTGWPWPGLMWAPAQAFVHNHYLMT